MSTKKGKHKLSMEDVGAADEQIAKLTIVKSLAVQEALSSGDINNIYKAQKYLQNQSQQIENKGKGAEPRSLLLDPTLMGADAYRNKQFRFSYDVLRAMARTPIVKAIIATRREQVAAFASPQKDKYTPGFVIKPKKAIMTDKGLKLTKEQEKRIDELTQFLLNCGDNPNEWHGDTFDSFTRKFISDSLELDQACAEVIRTKGGEPCEFISVDSATFRLANTYNDENNRKNSSLILEEKNGYLPYYVQVWQSRVNAVFYPWELIFGIRNPSSSMAMNGYGRSELEDLVETVTSLLNADQYNANFFKVGSNPKGILKVSGNFNTSRLTEFKEHWSAQMAGVRGAHKLAIIEADKMDFINTQMANKDMEYAQYQEFLIKIACAHYKIDPSEVGFPMNGKAVGDSGMGGDGGIEAKLEFSRDKGLKPLLKSYQSWINKFILDPKDNQYELEFVGLDVESPEKELENDVKAVTNWATVNEIRRKRGMKDLPGMDIILNPIAMQSKMAEMQQEQMNQERDQSTQFMDKIDPEDNKKNDDENNPFIKGLTEDIERLFTQERITA